MTGGADSGPLVAVVCAANRPDVLERMLLASLRRQTAAHELRVVDAAAEGFASAAAALNAGAADTAAPWLMFVHQDVAFADADFLKNAVDSMRPLADLGVAGPVGTALRPPAGKQRVTGRWLAGEPPRLIEINPPAAPTPVQTLDEMLLLVPRAVFDRLQFDPIACPDWHLYAADYCLSLARLGLRSYALPLLVHHLSGGALSGGYYATLRRVVRKHRRDVATICTTFENWPTRFPTALLKPLTKTRTALRLLRARLRGTT